MIYLTMVLYKKCSCGTSLVLLRNICLHPSLGCNPYKVLGLKPSATPSEIKAAFYELSKKHHPDKNQGCEKSEKKFKDIMAAYEILRNEKLRLKYDRELYSSGMPQWTAHNSRVDYDDEAERNFYEKTSRVKRRKYYGKTKQFNFDTWYEMHYGSVSHNNYSKYQNMYRQSSNQSVKVNSSAYLKPYVYTMHLIFGGLLFLFTYYCLHRKK